MYRSSLEVFCLKRRLRMFRISKYGKREPQTRNIFSLVVNLRQVMSINARCRILNLEYQKILIDVCDANHHVVLERN
jgi:hypothetical protein